MSACVRCVERRRADDNERLHGDAPRTAVVGLDGRWLCLDCFDVELGEVTGALRDALGVLDPSAVTVNVSLVLGVGGRRS